MIFVRIIDENGFFLKDAFIDMLTEFTIQESCPGGFYLPRWDGEKWIEGKTQVEINAILASIIIEPTAEERINNLETLILELGGII